MRSFDALLPAAILLAGLGVAALERPLAAQVAPPTNPQVPTAPQLPNMGRGNQPGDEDNPMMRQLSEQQAMKRNDARQKQIVDSTARLLHLAQELKEGVDKGTISPSSSAFARKAEEIEKLAKSVKDRMREGQ